MNYFLCKFFVIVMNDSRGKITIFSYRFTHLEVFLFFIILCVFMFVVNFFFNIR